MKTSEDLPEINDFDLNIDFDENKNIQTNSQTEKATPAGDLAPWLYPH